MNTSTQIPRWQQILMALGKAACYLALFLGWQLVVSTIYGFTISVELMLENPEGLLDTTAYLEAVTDKTMEMSLVSGLLTAASLAAFFKMRHRSLRLELWLHPVPKEVFGWSAGLAFCLYWLVMIILGFLPEAWLENYGAASAELEEISPLAFLATALVSPVVEEVIFRGLVYTRLQRAMPGWLAVILSAALFGLCHGEAVWFCYAFVLGVVFALLTQATRSVLPGMLMHVVFNTTNEVLTLLGDTEIIGQLLLLVPVLAVGGTALCVSRLFKLTSAPPSFALPEDDQK